MLATPTPAVTRLLCASISRVPGSVMEVLFSLREEARAVAAETPVRAALLYACGWFVLWLEGPEATVEAVRARAEADPRNASQMLLHRSRGAATLTEAFSLVALQVRDTPAAFGRRLFAAKALGVDAEPARLWQVLSAPSTLPAGSPLDVPDSCLGVIAADDHGPIDLLRRAGEAVASPVAYQRISDSSRRSGDVGLAYVDLPALPGPRRVLLLSRRALSHALVRHSLEGLQQVVALLGSRTQAALTLVQGLADVMRQLHAPPQRIVLVADEASLVRTVSGWLADHLPAGCRPEIVELPEQSLPALLAGEPVRTRALQGGGSAHRVPRFHPPMEPLPC